MKTKYLIKLYTYKNGIIPIVCTRTYISTWKYATRKILNFQGFWFTISKK